MKKKLLKNIGLTISVYLSLSTASVWSAPKKKGEVIVWYSSENADEASKEVTAQGGGVTGQSLSSFNRTFETVKVTPGQEKAFIEVQQQAGNKSNIAGASSITDKSVKGAEPIFYVSFAENNLVPPDEYELDDWTQPLNPAITDIDDVTAGMQLLSLSVPAPDDTPYVKNRRQWGMRKVGAYKAWERIGRLPDKQEDVIIAILDTGLYADHPKFARRVVQGYNALDGSTDTTDKHGHGTHCAGIALAAYDKDAKEDEDHSIAGIGGPFSKLKIMPIKVLDDNGHGSSESIARGIIWAADNGAKVISMSLSLNQESQIIKDAVINARTKGCIIVAAAGNYNTSRRYYPGAYADLCVGSTDPDDGKSYFSNHGTDQDKWVHLAAPGSLILSTFPPQFSQKIYKFLSGTSMATPKVAGLVALLKYKKPNAHNDDIIDWVKDSCDSLAGSHFAHGRINAFNAVEKTIEVSEANVVKCIIKRGGVETPQALEDGQKSYQNNSLLSSDFVYAGFKVTDRKGIPQQIAVTCDLEHPQGTNPLLCFFNKSTNKPIDVGRRTISRHPDNSATIRLFLDEEIKDVINASGEIWCRLYVSQDADDEVSADQRLNIKSLKLTAYYDNLVREESDQGKSANSKSD